MLNTNNFRGKVLGNFKSQKEIFENNIFLGFLEEEGGRSLTEDLFLRNFFWKTLEKHLPGIAKFSSWDSPKEE